MQPNIFREYDIRGIFGKEFMLEETYDLAKAIVSYFLQKDPSTKTIIVAMDGRTHSPAIKKKFVAAITDMGLNVIDIGLCPTPTFYFSLFTHKVGKSGIMITASHNPKEYNGFKICLNRNALWGKEIQKIKEIYQNKDFHKNTEDKKGIVEEYDALNAYINDLVKRFDHLKNFSLPFIIDCGNGTAGTVLPQIIKLMNWENVKLLFEKVDGNFPHHEADPTTIENMQEVLKYIKTHPEIELGIGFDGDCDRMNPITKYCFLVPGDKLLALYSKHVIEENPNAAIVFDIKSSDGLIELLEKWGAKPVIAPSGHSLIKDAMKKNNALLAGELSCHFFFKDRYFGYDDGIYAMMRLLEILEKEKKPLCSLLEMFPKKISSPEIRTPCKEEEKAQIIESVRKYFSKKEDVVKIIDIDGIRAHMKYGWGIARSSNTQPVISIRFESDTEERMKKIKEDFSQALKPYLEVTFR